jgi:light-regulated signal transduction histidine kinase (bacteriophytochrome)
MIKGNEPSPGLPAFPLRLFFSLLIVVFGFETLIMFILPLLLPNVNKVLVNLADSLLLTLLLSPVLYFLLAREKRARGRAEQALMEQSRELARSNAELEQFAYVASHDLREPLRMTHVYLQLLARRCQGKLDAEAEEFIGFAVDGAARMQRLIGDLLDYSRVGSRGMELSPMESGAALAQALDNLKLAVAESGAGVTQGPLPSVVADESQLVRLFQNLVGNALKFHGREAPRVHVGAELRKGEWLFSVHDNGIGIAPEHLERIFLIFSRVNGRDEYPGTGIGLAVCKKVVERHGGRIWVESKPGSGATFFFTIPERRGQ